MIFDSAHGIRRSPAATPTSARSSFGPIHSRHGPARNISTPSPSASRRSAFSRLSAEDPSYSNTFWSVMKCLNFMILCICDHGSRAQQAGYIRGPNKPLFLASSNHGLSGSKGSSKKAVVFPKLAGSQPLNIRQPILGLISINVHLKSQIQQHHHAQHVLNLHSNEYRHHLLAVCESSCGSSARPPLAFVGPKTIPKPRAQNHNS